MEHYTTSDCMQMFACNYRQLVRLCIMAGILHADACNFNSLPTDERDHRARVFDGAQVERLKALQSATLQPQKPTSSQGNETALLSRLAELEAIVQRQNEQIEALTLSLEASKPTIGPVTRYDGQEAILSRNDTIYQPTRQTSSDGHYRASKSRLLASSAGDTLPEGWKSLMEVIEQHGMKSTTIRRAAKDGRILCHLADDENEGQPWIRGVQHNIRTAVSPDQLGSIFAAYPPLQTCGDETCPCAGLTTLANNASAGDA